MVGCYRLPSSWSPFETKSGAVTGKLASRQAQPIQPERAQDHTIFSAPSVAVGGERAATSVRRLLNPARSLENGRSVYWVAFQARNRHKLFRSRNFVRLLVRRVSTVSFLSRKSCSSWQVACEDAIEKHNMVIGTGRT